MSDLFDMAGPRSVPLAEALRPDHPDAILGQDHLLGPDGSLRHMLSGTLSSFILWGPPGVGKTTIARAVAQQAGLPFVAVSAIFTGVSELRKIFDEARIRGSATLLFVDEIHRFSKSQQDSFLPHMEDGTIILIGATTENPSFELNSALLSRAQIYVLQALDDAALETLLARAEQKLGQSLPLTEAARKLLIEMAHRDGRALLNLVEQIAQSKDMLDETGLKTRLNARAAHYDKNGDQHYNLISALHKSVRGSDPDAALYWLARMLGAGEDPRYLARRITRMAVEDIGLADPDAQRYCLEAWQLYERLGSPEGELALAQAVIYLALAPKSNASYVAYKQAMTTAQQTSSLSPPAHILNAPTRLMKEIGYGAGYQYDHDAAEGFSGQNYFPDAMTRENYYQPVERGHERELQKRLRYFEGLRGKRNNKDAD